VVKKQRCAMRINDDTITLQKGASHETSRQNKKSHRQIVKTTALSYPLPMMPFAGAPMYLDHHHHSVSSRDQKESNEERKQALRFKGHNDHLLMRLAAGATPASLTLCVRVSVLKAQEQSKSKFNNIRGGKRTAEETHTCVC
jgi:hypothetical protein